MSRHAALTRRAIGTMASGVDFTNNTLPDEVSVLFLRDIAVHCFYQTHKLMTWHSVKTQIAAHNLKISVADTRQQDADKGFAIHRLGLRIVSIKHKASFSVNQCTHHIAPDLLFPTSCYSILARYPLKKASEEVNDRCLVKPGGKSRECSCTSSIIIVPPGNRLHFHTYWASGSCQIGRA